MGKNIVWHKSSVEKFDREELLKQKGCVIWVTGLSGSGSWYLISFAFTSRWMVSVLQLSEGYAVHFIDNFFLASFECYNYNFSGLLKF